MKNRWVYLYFI